MNGHQPLIAMRRAGLVPPAVFVTDGAVEFDLDKNWTDELRGSVFAHVRIDERDIPEALDLRFAVGMQIHIDGLRGDDRAKCLHDAFVATAPKLVATITKDNFWIYHRG